MSNILEIGSEWGSIDALKHACTTYAIEKRFPMKIVKRNVDQFDMRCKNDGCIWRVYASKYEAPKFVIKKFVDEHYNCPGARMSNSAADSHFIANVIAVKVKEKPDYAPCEILEDINRDLRIKVSYAKAFRAKQKAINDLNGTPEEGYANLPQYCDKLREANPDSSIILEMAPSDVDMKFKRLFIAYRATIDGFVHCKPLLGLDGTHLTSKYGGILLAATAMDAEGQLFPFAFAIVSIENDDNWEWFLGNLHALVKDNLPIIITMIDDIIFLSDRQKGLLEGVGTWFPGSAHGYCLRHLVDNFSKHFKHKDLTKLLWQAARATMEAEFKASCNAMRVINVKCVDWLLNNAHSRHWATVYFPGHRYGYLISNISESLNAWLL